MLKSGEKDVKWTQEEFTGVDKPAAKGETKWYETINYDILDPPYCVRPKGGHRFEISSFANLQDKALEIKESAPWRFKHSGDVNRNAHYIGMYILEQLYIKSGKFSAMNDMEHKIAPFMENIKQKTFYRNYFERIFENYVTGIISADALIEAQDSIAKSIEDEGVKKWFNDDCIQKMSSETEIRKVKNRLSMREARGIAKEKGFSVV